MDNSNSSSSSSSSSNSSTTTDANGGDDLSRFKISRPAAATATQGVLPIFRPAGTTAVRVRAESSAPPRVHVIEVFRDGFYLVESAIAGELGALSQVKDVYVACDEFQTVFLWPINTTKPANGRADSWSSSASLAVVAAETTWVYVTANTPQWRYDYTGARGVTTSPKWPTEPLDSLVFRAFAGRLITSTSHPAVAAARAAAEKQRR